MILAFSHPENLQGTQGEGSEQEITMEYDESEGYGKYKILWKHIQRTPNLNSGVQKGQANPWRVGITPANKAWEGQRNPEYDLKAVNTWKVNLIS